MSNTSEQYLISIEYMKEVSDIVEESIRIGIGC